MPKKKQPSPGVGWAGVDVALLKRDITALCEQRWQWLASVAQIIEKHARPGVDVTSAPVIDTLDLLWQRGLRAVRSFVDGAAGMESHISEHRCAMQSRC